MKGQDNILPLNFSFFATLSGFPETHFWFALVEKLWPSWLIMSDWEGEMEDAKNP